MRKSAFWLSGSSYGALVFVMAMSATGSSYAALTISSAATQNMTCASGICTPTTANAVLNVGDLTTMLGSGNVTVNTGTGSLAAQVEDIIVAASFNWTSANSLTLDAYRSVTVTAPVAVNGAAPVSLITNDGGSGGNLFFISGGSLSFLGTTNSLSINGKSYALEASIAALAAAIKHESKGFYALSTNYDASHDGTYRSPPISKKFKGTVNGLGNTISNLTINSRETTIGFFSYLDTSAALDSLRLTNAKLTARENRGKRGAQVGMIAAVNYGTVFNTFAEGQINVTAGRYGAVTGGLAAGNSGVILDSATSVTLVLADAPVFSAGGLVAENSGEIEGSFATGNVTVTGQNTGGVSGGLVGDNGGTIENCYAEGAVTIPGQYDVGGLTGIAGAAIVTSYSTGVPAGGSGSAVGGFVGYDGSSGGLSNDDWDTTTSGIANLSQGAGNIANDPGITGQTTAQLQAGLPAGFDPTIWAENSSINNGLPYLIANPPQ